MQKLKRIKMCLHFVNNSNSTYETLGIKLQIKLNRTTIHRTKPSQPNRMLIYLPDANNCGKIPHKREKWKINELFEREIFTDSQSNEMNS